MISGMKKKMDHEEDLPIDRLVIGVGINDVRGQCSYQNYEGAYQKKTFYTAWRNMLERCYGTKKEQQKPTNISYSMDPCWHRLSVFKVWFDEHYIEGYELDKNLLESNKVYSSEYCVFVPPWLNKLFTKSVKVQGKYPLGVSWNVSKGKYMANIIINGNKLFLGYHTTPEQAAESYQRAVEFNILQRIDEWVSGGNGIYKPEQHGKIVSIIRGRTQLL